MYTKAKLSLTLIRTIKCIYSSYYGQGCVFIWFNGHNTPQKWRILNTIDFDLYFILIVLCMNPFQQNFKVNFPKQHFCFGAR